MDMNQMPYGAAPVKKPVGLGVASMVCGILSLVLSCCVPYLPLILALVAVVLGAMGIKKNAGKGMAIAGTICGGIGALVGLVTTIINFVNISNGENELYNNLMSQLEGAIQLIIK